MGNREIPSNAALFACEMQLGDNGDGAKTAPVTMVARTGDAIQHWYWGQVVHDLDGMKMRKPRIRIDYCHQSDVPMGYVNKADTSSGDLVVSGALIPRDDKPGDMVSEVLFYGRQGVPYEASIDFRDEMTVEEVEPGVEVEVNGRSYVGPLTIIREWYLRSMGICPDGADPNTSAQFNKWSEEDTPKTLNINVITNGESVMSNEQSEAIAVDEAVAVEDEAVEEMVAEVENAEQAELSADAAEPVEEASAEDAVENEEGVDAEEAEEQAEEEAFVEAEEEKQPEPTEGQRFLAAFGDKGGVWFAQGKSFDEATQLYIEDLAAERDALKSKVAELSASLTPEAGIDPVSFASGGPCGFRQERQGGFDAGDPHQVAGPRLNSVISKPIGGICNGR